MKKSFQITTIIVVSTLAVAQGYSQVNTIRPVTPAPAPVSPNSNLGTPSANGTVSGQPGTALGQPGTALGQPGTALGQPNNALGQPNNALGQPNTAITPSGTTNVVMPSGSVVTPSGTTNAFVPGGTVLGTGQNGLQGNALNTTPLTNGFIVNPDGSVIPLTQQGGSSGTGLGATNTGSGFSSPR